MVAKAANSVNEVLRPLDDVLDVRTADLIAQLKLDDKLQAKLDDYAERSPEGALSPSERAEYLELVEAIDVLSIFQAKARDVLNRQSQL